MDTLETRRLSLVPLDLPLLRLIQTSDWRGLATSLEATIAEGWPSRGVLEHQVPRQITLLQSDAALLPWLGRLILWRDGRVLVGGVNVKGLPDANGSVEIGYEVAPGWRRRGIATEAAEAVTEWCLSQPQVARVLARTQIDNQVSAHMLRRMGFAESGRVHDAELGDMITWARTPPPMEQTLLVVQGAHQTPRGIALTGRSPACALCGTGGVRGWIGREATLRAPDGQSATAVIADSNLLPAGFGEEFQVSVLFGDLPESMQTPGTVVTLPDPRA